MKRAKMQDITKKYLEIHGYVVKCPKCKSEDVLIGINEERYFWISKCNDCGYEGKVLVEGE